MLSSTYMSLTIWNLESDLYSHSQLGANFTKLDQHDHSTGNGKQITSTGIAAGAIGNAQLADSAVESINIAANTITGNNISPTTTITSYRWTPVNSTSSSYTASNGQIVFCKNYTNIISLPVPNAGSEVIVYNFPSSYVGTTEVSSSANGGYIYMPNSSSLTTVIIDSVYSYIHFIADGTNWYGVAGTVDSGWQSLSLNSSVTNEPGYSYPSAKVFNNRCYLDGQIVGNTGTVSGNTSIATLPLTIMFPAYPKYILANSGEASSLTLWPLKIQTNGTIFTVNSFSSTSIMDLSGLSFPLDH